MSILIFLGTSFLITVMVILAFMRSGFHLVRFSLAVMAGIIGGSLAANLYSGFDTDEYLRRLPILLLGGVVTIVGVGFLRLVRFAIRQRRLGS